MHDVGTVQRNPGMARTYERIAKRGARAFYRGPIAEAMADAAQSPPVVPGHDRIWRPGLLTTDDIAQYEAIERKPTHTRYRGLDVYGMAPPSSGGSTVGEALNIIEGVPGFGSLSRTQQYHWFLEASRFAFADRNRYVGDPAYVDVPLRGPAVAVLRGRAPGADRPRAGVGEPGGAGRPRGDGGATLTRAAAGGGADDQPLRSTTHLTVADAKGTVVSYTFTIESTGGNGIVVPGWGFLLNNELTDFNFTPTQGRRPTRTCPRGGKRPRSSMAPTIVQRNGRPVLATGSPGGATIITTVLQVLLERLDFGKSLPAAIAAPRASQRNSGDDAGGAGVHRLARGAGAQDRVRARLRHARAHAADQRRDRRGDGHRLAAVRASCRRRRSRRGAAAARRAPCAAAAAATAAGAASRSRPSPEHGQRGAGVVHDGVRVRQRLGRERAGGDRDHAHAVDARARDVARRVADHDRALARPAARPRRARSRAARRAPPRPSRSRPGRARRSGRCPRAASLRRATGSRLPVTSASR